MFDLKSLFPTTHHPPHHTLPISFLLQDLAGLVRSATSFALERAWGDCDSEVCVSDVSMTVDPLVTAADLDRALAEITDSKRAPPVVEALMFGGAPRGAGAEGGSGFDHPVQPHTSPMTAAMTAPDAAPNAAVEPPQQPPAPAVPQADARTKRRAEPGVPMVYTHSDSEEEMAGIGLTDAGRPAERWIGAGASPAADLGADAHTAEAHPGASGYMVAHATADATALSGADAYTDAAATAAAVAADASAVVGPGPPDGMPECKDVSSFLTSIGTLHVRSPRSEASGLSNKRENRR